MYQPRQASYTLTMAATALLFSLATGCTQDGSAAGGSGRLVEQTTPGGMATVVDVETGLEWVNDADACNPLGALDADAVAEAQVYCAELMFAGHDDWRMPSESEAAELILVAIEERFELVYQNPGCPAVLAMGGVAVATHNDENPGVSLADPPSVGLRCLRQTQ